jgi:Protein of unknown function (DUF4446)
MGIELIIAIVATVMALASLAWSFALAGRIRQLTAARNSLARMASEGDLVGAMTAVDARLAELAQADVRLGIDDQAIVIRLESAVRHVGLVRFDALPGDVGEQSFSVALLDDHATGFVLTSMYGRGAYRLYAKPVTDGASELVLTDEEMEAAARALRGTGLTVAGERRSRRG